ncbi:conserved hypothetical protein [Gloeothece citriformis PCC 7424]|uniref:Phage tail protein n=1 Tax=Gloeothece citriformis (strain PCC 7424) TaxID=65393 RepID=B7KB55_GLOC7|nr:phage tail protein [Gloeothece citriformis]ACK70165.1 conserved hypothetical protein [Gloeothece citriformis PCC 7424]
MPELSKPIAPTSFYLEIAGVVDGEKSIFKSVKIPQYQPKVQGGQQVIGCTKGGKTIRQVNSGGFEGLFSFDCVCVASGDDGSTSKLMYDWFKKCLPTSDGGQGKWADNRKSGAITAYDTDGKEVAKWEFVDAFPSKYKCADLDVSSSNYLDETYTITCEKFNRTQ